VRFVRMAEAARGKQMTLAYSNPDYQAPHAAYPRAAAVSKRKVGLLPCDLSLSRFCPAVDRRPGRAHPRRDVRIADHV